MTKFILINEYFSTPWNGFGGRTYEIAQAMGRGGHDVTVISSKHHHHIQEDYRKIEGLVNKLHFNLVLIPSLRYKASTSKLRMFNWVLFCFCLPLLTSKFIRDRGDSVVIYSSPSLLGGLGAWLLAKAIKAKFVFEVRDIWPLSLVDIGGYNPNNFLIKCLFKLELFLYRKSDAIFSNLKFFDEYLFDLEVERPFFWLPNGITKNQLKQAQRQSQIHKKQIPSKKFIIGYSGALGEANEIETLLDASTYLDPEKFEIRVLGDGSQRSNLEKYTMQIEGCQVTFLGRKSKSYVIDFLHQADCLYVALPNLRIFKYGVSPNKLFEYMLVGKPVLYGINSGKYDPIESEGIGKKIRIGDPQNLAASIEKLSALTVDELDQIRLRSIKVLKRSYLYDDIATRMFSICEKLD